MAIHFHFVILVEQWGVICPMVQLCAVGPITPHSNLNLPSGQDGRTREQEQNCTRFPLNIYSSKIIFTAKTPSSTPAVTQRCPQICLLNVTHFKKHLKQVFKAS